MREESVAGGNQTVFDGGAGGPLGKGRDTENGAGKKRHTRWTARRAHALSCALLRYSTSTGTVVTASPASGGQGRRGRGTSNAPHANSGGCLVTEAGEAGAEEHGTHSCMVFFTRGLARGHSDIRVARGGQPQRSLHRVWRGDVARPHRHAPRWWRVVPRVGHVLIENDGVRDVDGRGGRCRGRRERGRSARAHQAGQQAGQRPHATQGIPL